MQQITCLFCGTPYPETKPGAYTCQKCGARLTITTNSATQTAPGAVPKEFYTTTEAGELLHRHPRTIMRKCAAHEIEAVKVGKGYLIPAHALRAILETTPAKPRKKRGAPAPQPEPIPEGWSLDTSAFPTEADFIEAVKGWPEK